MKHSYLIVWILSLVIIGSAAVFIVQLDQIVPTVGTPNTAPRTALPYITPAPATPPAPSITLFIQKSKTGNTFVVQWQNLPESTVALNIFRSKTDADDWSLWKTVALTSDELTNGTTQINLGEDTEAGYSFQVEAVGGGGGGDGNNGSSTTPIWTSSSTIPVVTTSTPPTPPENPPPSENPPQASSTNESSTPSNNSSTNQNPPVENNSSSTSSSTSQGNNPPPGNPYYNPQVQISGYGTAPGSFWVQRVNNQSVQIGWQNIPTDVDTITVARSASSTGPWNTIIIQHNPGATGSYSLQLIDNTLDDPYYYEMTALEGTTTITTYGPEYLEGTSN